MFVCSALALMFAMGANAEGDPRLRERRGRERRDPARPRAQRRCRRRRPERQVPGSRLGAKTLHAHAGKLAAPATASVLVPF